MAEKSEKIAIVRVKVLERKVGDFDRKTNSYPNGQGANFTFPGGIMRRLFPCDVVEVPEPLAKRWKNQHLVEIVAPGTPLKMKSMLSGTKDLCKFCFEPLKTEAQKKMGACSNACEQAWRDVRKSQESPVTKIQESLRALGASGNVLTTGVFNPENLIPADSADAKSDKPEG